MAERAYQMIRISAGDYLLPSNDGLILWRLQKYEEDGTATVQSGPGAPERALRGTFWSLYRWDGGFPTPEQVAASLEAEDWERWQFWGGPFDTRNDAIRDALR